MQQSGYGRSTSFEVVDFWYGRANN